MAKVQPVNVPNVGVGTTLEVTVLPFSTRATTAQTWNKLIDDEGKEVIPTWNYTLTEEEYNSWGIDNSVVDDFVAAAKGLVIVPDAPEAE